MNEHPRISDLLPLYVSGGLDRDQRLAVEEHLTACADCRMDLALWKDVSGEIAASDRAVAAPRGLAARALTRAQTRRSRPGRVLQNARHAAFHIGLLLRSQMLLVQREIWPASALVIGLGYIVALMTAQTAVMDILAPLVAATCISMLYGPENDPALELALSTPTSPRQILLARLVLVFGYNLGLVLVATLGLLPMLAARPPLPVLGTLILAWLAPMTFLSAAALVLSLWVGVPNAISLTYIAWLAHLLVGPLRSPQAGLMLSRDVWGVMTAYQDFWKNPLLLLVLSAFLFGGAVWMAGRSSRGQLEICLSRDLAMSEPVGWRIL